MKGASFKGSVVEIPKAEDMPEADLANALRRKVSDLAELMELARLRGISVDFQIRPDPNGKFKVSEIKISKTTVL